VQPVEPVAPTQQNTETFDGGKFNPDELPAELQQGWKQLQAAFTQATQHVAEQRNQIEALGDIESVQQAVDLYTRITDPANWQQLHTELSQAMQEAGMSPAAAQAAATEAVTAQQAQELPVNLDAIDDPELAPLAQLLKQQQAEIAELRTTQQSDIEARQQHAQQQQLAAQAEYERQAFLGELQRQENIVRAAHPGWNDEKVLAAYELSSFYGGNLTKGAERLQTILSGERELYLSEKASAMDATGRIAAPRAAGSQSTHVDEGPRTVRDAEAEAMEFFQARVNQLSE
jgi:glycine cleavage system regulatory protein